MLLTIATTHRPATDLGYLLHKHPDRVQPFPQPAGVATVFYPQAGEERTTAALLLEVDPVKLTRSSRNSPDFSLGQYVNDRPYAASSLLGVALAAVFSTARAGVCKARQALADTAIPLEIEMPVLPARGGPQIVHRLFAPLGWAVEADPLALDERFPQWGESRYVRLRLAGVIRLADALNQLHVLLPVLDESKHYWQNPDEVDKLLRSGGAWLAGHPDRELITRRYLRRTGVLTRLALARLAEVDDATTDALEPPDEGAPPGEGAVLEGPELEGREPQEAAVSPGGAPSGVGGGTARGGGSGTAAESQRLPLNAQRHVAVLRALSELGAKAVIDLGCGPGAFLAQLVQRPDFTRVAGSDVCARSLQQAGRRLHLDTMSERQAERIELFQSALTYEDQRLAGYDAAVLMEVIEHVDPSRLPALERVVFGAARPGAVIVTTPNADYNSNYPGLTGMRHPDHRFEFSRAEFAEWSAGVAEAQGYRVVRSGVGESDPALGSPTQMAVFTRA
ncbi:MAG: 3' terminal RNA ribose 2'-O-methyltransferase Hen1 [Candidatus Nanopelagicales bacterium]